jgi:hypothetical protein
MRIIQIFRFLFLLSVAFLGAMVVPQTAHAFPLCPGLPYSIVTCAEVTDQCTSGGGTPSFTWLGLCQDEYQYWYEYYSVSCSGVLYSCAAYP